MTKRNLTVQLDEDVISRARVVADKRGTSISQLVAQQIEQLADDDERYEAARKRAMELMDTAATHGGGRQWKREDLYDR
jgi:hypothetical protein